MTAPAMPDARGRFVPETLMTALDELEAIRTDLKVCPYDGLEMCRCVWS
ncbi:MAG: hypothetical protein IIB88_07260 [Chloroflexi bacterium]|nr:hypothetical protein [Chloroflexota bacterium]